MNVHQQQAKWIAFRKQI